MCWFFSRKPLLYYSKAASPRDSLHLITPVDTLVSKEAYLNNTSKKHRYAGMDLGICIAHALKIHCYLFYFFFFLIPQEKPAFQYEAKKDQIFGDSSLPGSSF